MICSANIATYPPRRGTLPRVIESIYPYFDVIRIYYNQYSEPLKLNDPDNKIKGFVGDNLTDNGKFYYLDHLTEPEYFFSMDDDILYPKSYKKETLKFIEDYGCIVTYHGRQLISKGRNYYRGHRSFHCLTDWDTPLEIDVAGTGVTAFDTRFFHPKGLANASDKKMSDLIFSLEASKQNKLIGLMPHKGGWIKAIAHKEDIYSSEQGNPRQTQLADEIFTIKYGDKDTTNG